MANWAGHVGSMYVGVPGFYETFFGNVAETAAKTAFEKWREGDNPLYYEESGWDGWSLDTKRLELDQYFRIITYLVLVGENDSMSLANTLV